MKLHGKLVTVRVIENQDMLFIQKLWGNYETMESEGGTYKVKDEDFNKLFMILNKEDKLFNHYIIETDEGLVGDFSIREIDDSNEGIQINLKIEFSKRNKGYGKEVLELFMDYYFKKSNGSKILIEMWAVTPFVDRKLKGYGFNLESVSVDATKMSLVSNDYYKN